MNAIAKKPAVVHKIIASWKEDLVFDSHIGNHIIPMDSPGLGNDAGPSPKKLFLSAIAGCTGMDVTSLLKKMRVPFTGLEIEVEGDLTDEHPKVYSEIRLIYRLSGKNLNHSKVMKAIVLSQEKYCGISAMVRKACPVHYAIEYVDEGASHLLPSSKKILNIDMGKS